MVAASFTTLRMTRTNGATCRARYSTKPLSRNWQRNCRPRTWILFDPIGHGGKSKLGKLPSGTPKNAKSQPVSEFLTLRKHCSASSEESYLACTVPKGRPIVAQRFIAGVVDRFKPRCVPSGTRERNKVIPSECTWPLTISRAPSGRPSPGCTGDPAINRWASVARPDGRKRPSLAGASG